MQKVINVVAILSGLTSVALIGGSAYLLLNKDAMIESAKEQVTKEVTKAVTGALPGLVNSAMPELPGATGGVVPETGGNVPSVLPGM